MWVYSSASCYSPSISDYTTNTTNVGSYADTHITWSIFLNTYPKPEISLYISGLSRIIMVIMINLGKNAETDNKWQELYMYHKFFLTFPLFFSIYCFDNKNFLQCKVKSNLFVCFKLYSLWWAPVHVFLFVISWFDIGCINGGICHITSLKSDSLSSNNGNERHVPINW